MSNSEVKNISPFTIDLEDSEGDMNESIEGFKGNDVENEPSCDADAVLSLKSSLEGEDVQRKADCLVVPATSSSSESISFSLSESKESVPKRRRYRRPTGLYSLLIYVLVGYGRITARPYKLFSKEFSASRDVIICFFVAIFTFWFANQNLRLVGKGWW